MPRQECGPSLTRPLLAGLLATTFVVLAQPALAGDWPGDRESRRPYRIHPASASIVVDGVLDDPGWSEVAPIPLAFEYLPGENVEPPVETVVLVTYDGSSLYLAFRASDPDPSRIRAHLMDRDEIDTFVKDDHVVVLLDTFDDQRRAYQLRVNPLGVQADAFNSDVGESEDWAFDLLWESAGRMTADGYVVEMAVPFEQLRFPAESDELTWGVTFERSWPRTLRHQIADHPVDRNVSCTLCQMSRMTGIQGIAPGRNLELDPTVTTTRTDRRETPSAETLEAGPTDVEPGVTVRWGPSPGVSIEGTLNPDFSQVEADAIQLDVNERFALLYPEKRPFFLEGGDVFDTPLDVVFTRTVVDPSWGLKVTGKVGSQALGAFVAKDEVNSFLLPSNEGTDFASLEEEITAGVLRYRRDVGARSALGLLYTDRSGTGYHNRVGGVDGFLRFGEGDALSFQLLRSHTLDPPDVLAQTGRSAESFAGDALKLRYEHIARGWFWVLDHQSLDREFRADSGFIPRVDFRTTEIQLGRRFWPGGGSRWTQLEAWGDYLRTEDQRGELTDEDFQAGFYARGPWQSLFYVEADRKSQRSGGVLHRDLLQKEAGIEVQPHAQGFYALWVDWGETVDLANHQRADFLVLSPFVELQPGRRWNLQLLHYYQQLEVAAGELSEANLSQLRVVYSFGPRTFVRTVVQRRGLTQDPASFIAPVEAETEELFGQLLYAYRLNARSALFAGYAESRRGLAGAAPTPTDRTFFVKLSYAWLP